MVQHENALNLLETKLSSLVEMARSLASNNRAAEPLLSSNNQQTDSFFSQQVRHPCEKRGKNQLDWTLSFESLTRKCRFYCT